MRLWPLLLVGCALSTTDLDGDGFAPLEGDCDDWDPSIHPAAIDAIADGIDEDCDGVEPMVIAHGVAHTCTLFTDGEIACTGDDTWGQLAAPKTVFVWTDLVAGDYHSCALDLMGAVTCWGDDRAGQSSPPEDLPPADRIGAGPDFAWAQGTSWPRECWGRCY